MKYNMNNNILSLNIKIFMNNHYFFISQNNFVMLKN